MRLRVGMLALLALADLSVTANARPGALVVEVKANSAAEKAGIVRGDSITGWQVDDASDPHSDAEWQPVRSPFDVVQAGLLLSSSQKIRVQLLRNDALQDLDIGIGPLGIDAQPSLASGPGTYEAIRAAAAADRITRLEALLRDEAYGDANLAWILSEISAAAFADGQRERGNDALQRAIDALQASPDLTHMTQGLLYLRAGGYLWQSGDYALADEMLRNAITAFRERDELPLQTAAAVARAENLRGRVAAYAGELDHAADYSAAALAAQRRLAPGSLAVAETLQTLGTTAFWQGKIDLAETRYREALAIREQLADGSVDHGRSVGTLGLVAWRRGDLDAAENYFLEAYEVHSRALPNSVLAAGQLTMLGHVASDRKKFRDAERYYFRSLAITEKYFPGEETVANTLMGLGNAARKQFNLAAARSYHGRAMEIYENLGARQRLSLVLANLGNVELDAGRAAEASDYYRRSLELRVALGARPSMLAPLQSNMANAARREGRLEDSRRQLREVLEVFRQSAPGSLRVHEALFALAEVELDDNDPDAAEPYLLEALSLAERLAPGTLYEAEPMHRLGRIALLRNQADRARTYFFRAIDAFEAQRKLVGGNSDAQRNFTAAFGYLYKELAELLIRQNEPVAAFDVVERYRARVLMATVLGRAQDVERPVPAAIRDEWQETQRDYDASLGAVMAAALTSDAEIAGMLSRLDDHRDRRDTLLDRYRSLYPQRAAFEYPEPQPLLEADGVVAEDTALLSYLLTENGAYLFVVTADPDSPVRLIQLDVDPAELAVGISVFADLLKLHAPNAALTTAQWRAAADLYARLVGPAESLIASQETLIVLADGPLHALPFAALTTNSPGPDGPRYLVETHALQFAPSLDWLIATKKQAVKASRGAVTVFADPEFSESTVDMNRPASRSLGLQRLPGARREAASIAGLFDNAQTYLGERATEANAKAVSGRDLGLLHFATHGVMDQERPMESFLLLAASDTDGRFENGLLQAYEIAEQIELPGALVVLSACSTGAGKLAAGEGVVGLSSAFLYAGASGVVSTLWAVSDDSTSELMVSFYRALKRGQSPARALRSAQLRMIEAARDRQRGFRAWLSRLPLPGSRSPANTAGAHWAAFRLHGEPR